MTNTAIISHKNQNENYLSKVGHIYFDVINNDKDPKFKHEYYVMTLIIKTLFQIFQNISIIPNRSEEFFLIELVKNTMARTYVIKDLIDEKFI